MLSPIPSNSKQAQVFDYLNRLKDIYDLPFFFIFTATDEPNDIVQPMTVSHNAGREKDALEALKVIFKNNPELRKFFKDAIDGTNFVNG